MVDTHITATTVKSTKSRDNDTYDTWCAAITRRARRDDITIDKQAQHATTTTETNDIIKLLSVRKD